MAFDEKLFDRLMKNSKADFDYIYFENIDSTNIFAKKKDFEKTTVIISSEQSKGKGRLGRHFISEKDKGIYFSVVKYGLTKDQISLLTIATAVCVCEVLEEECNKDFSVKWVNDILLDDKKICGILVENTCDKSENCIKKSVIGIGINLYGKVDERISGIASSVEMMTGKILSSEKVVFGVVNRLETFFNDYDKSLILQKYRQKCITLNRDVLVNTFTDKFSAFALEIDDEGCLLVDTNGRKILLNSGEVSVLPLKQ